MDILALSLESTGVHGMGALTATIFGALLLPAAVPVLGAAGLLWLALADGLSGSATQTYWRVTLVLCVLLNAALLHVTTRRLRSRRARPATPHEAG